MAGDFLTFAEAADALHVSARHARRLADAGQLTKVARGLVDRDSVDRHLSSQRQGRTRAWAEHTAWGAIALLAGQDADWLGATQRSRVRRTLLGLEDVSELLARLRDRAQIRRFAAHRSALPRLRETIAVADQRRLGLVDAADEALDGYIDAARLDATIRSLGLREGGDNVTLRITAFDFTRVAELVTTCSVPAALDAAGSTDPRTRGVGRRALGDLLGGFR